MSDWCCSRLPCHAHHPHILPPHPVRQQAGGASLTALTHSHAQGNAGYDQYGLGTSTGASEENPSDRNPGNNLPTSVTDGPDTTVIATYPCGGPDLFPDFSEDCIEAFITAILNLLRSLDQQASCEFQNVQLLTKRRSLLVCRNLLAGRWGMAEPEPGRLHV